jgi:hypothetical protein
MNRTSVGFGGFGGTEYFRNLLNGMVLAVSIGIVLSNGFNALSNVRLEGLISGSQAPGKVPMVVVLESAGCPWVSLVGLNLPACYTIGCKGIPLRLT